MTYRNEVAYYKLIHQANENKSEPQPIPKAKTAVNEVIPTYTKPKKLEQQKPPQQPKRQLIKTN